MQDIKITDKEILHNVIIRECKIEVHQAVANGPKEITATIIVGAESIKKIGEQDKSGGNP